MRDILLHSEDFGHWNASASYAAQLSARRKGRLTGCFVSPSPRDAVSPILSPDLLCVMTENLNGLQDQAIEKAPAFIQWAHAEGAERASWVAAQGDAVEVLAHLGARHDALVIERGEGIWGTPVAVADRALGAGLPCFVVPSGSDYQARLSCVAIAWNATHEAMRAIHAALPLLADAGRVVVLSGPPRDAFAEAGWEPVFDIAGYFSDHGIRVEQHPLRTDKPVGEALLSECKKLDADLLVMGAYGHSRLREWILGGATHHVLRHAHLPLLLHH